MWRCTFLPAAGGTFLKYSGRDILSGFQSFSCLDLSGRFPVTVSDLFPF